MYNKHVMKLQEVFDTSLSPVVVPSHPGLVIHPRAAIEDMPDSGERKLPTGHISLVFSQQAKREI